VQGVLQAINYQDGTFVKEGTTLFTIEPETYKLKLEQAQAAEAGAQAFGTETSAAAGDAGRELLRLRMAAECVPAAGDRKRDGLCGVRDADGFRAGHGGG